MNILSTSQVTKSYPSKAGADAVEVLKGIDIEIRQGSVTAIVGASGSGKSTLMHILGGLDKPSNGEVRFRDSLISSFNDDELSRFRNREIGFVFQFHHLLPEFTALENVMMPALIRNIPVASVIDKARQLLNGFGLGNRLDHRPAMLSGGEQQRVSIARALINDPAILLADEPTGNLDEQNTSEIIEQIIALRDARDLTVVMVTHDMDIARKCDSILTLKNGIVVQ